MALRDSKLVRIIGWTMFALVAAAFSLRVLVMVSSGHGGDPYVGGRGLPWTYVSALVTLIAIGLALAFAGAARLWKHLQRWRNRREG
jgi:hypothetical protein